MTVHALLAARAAVAAVGLSVLALAVVVPAGRSEAAGYSGYCRDASGVTVVVDFNNLGGGTVVRCAPITSGSGLDALRAAGFSMEGVRRWGDSFACRINGRPGASQDLAVSGGPGYREQCIDTPPATAYWSYWYADNGGSWRYSQAGVKNRRVIPGGFEGWSFSLNDAGGAPSAVPRRPVVATPSPTRPAGTPTRPSAASPTTSSGSGSSAGTRTTSADRTRPAGTADTPRATGRSANASAGGTAAGTAADRTTTTSSTTSSTTSPATTPTTDPATTTPASAADETTAALAGGPVSATTTGVPAGTLVGVGGLAFLVTAGVGTAWARRRAR